MEKSKKKWIIIIACVLAVILLVPSIGIGATKSKPTKMYKHTIAVAGYDCLFIGRDCPFLFGIITYSTSKEEIKDLSQLSSFPVDDGSYSGNVLLETVNPCLFNGYSCDMSYVILVDDNSNFDGIFVMNRLVSSTGATFAIPDESDIGGELTLNSAASECYFVQCVAGAFRFSDLIITDTVTEV